MIPAISTTRIRRRSPCSSRVLTTLVEEILAKATLDRRSAILLWVIGNEIVDAGMLPPDRQPAATQAIHGAIDQIVRSSEARRAGKGSLFRPPRREILLSRLVKDRAAELRRAGPAERAADDDLVRRSRRAERRRHEPWS
jgi:hypothetical protein